MPDRKSLVPTLWLILSLGLLASVLIAPTQTPGFVAVSSGLHGLSLKFGPSPARPMPLLSAGMATDAVPKMKALPPEVEEQDLTDALDEPRTTFPIPCSFRKILGRRLTAPHAVLSLYPLRC